MSFSRKPLQPSIVTTKLKRHPFALFGLPFVAIIVAGSFALSSLTQTRYNLRDEKVHAMSKEEELGMRKDRRKFDVREEYYRLAAKGDDHLDNWENKRVERLPGQAEWGELPAKKN
ncbi:cytochrome c oxidase-like protein [Meredithblackwellia eburnea MCA 4105]